MKYFRLALEFLKVLVWPGIALYGGLIWIIARPEEGGPPQTIRQIGIVIVVMLGIGEGFSWLARAHVTWKRRVMVYSTVIGMVVSRVLHFSMVKP